MLIAYDGSDPAKQAISAAAELFAGRPAYVVTIWEPGLAYAMADLEPTGPELSPIPMDIQGSQELEDDLQVHARRTAAEGAELAEIRRASIATRSWSPIASASPRRWSRSPKSSRSPRSSSARGA